MTDAAVLTELKTYARRVREARRANPAVSEPGLAPQFQRLVEALLPLLASAPKLTVSPEYTNPGVGRPDIALKRPGEVARAFIELKAADKAVDGSTWKTPHDKRQFERFPAERVVFDAAAALGAEIRGVETFARPPGPAFTKGVARVLTTPKGKLAGALEPDEGVLVLCADGSGKVGPIPAAAWRFSVSGYRVLPRWLGAREAVAVDEAFTKALRDLVGRIGELVDLFARADDILEATLAEPLSRSALGLETVEDAEA